MHCGDLMLTSATVLSGNNFQKIELFCKILGLPIVSSSTFHKMQRSYIVPSIDKFWQKHLDDIYTKFQGKEVVVLGKYISLTDFDIYIYISHNCL